MNVEETAAAITDMTIRGAGKIARAGASALSVFAGSYSGNDRETFLKDLEKAKKTLLDSRPTTDYMLTHSVDRCVPEYRDWQPGLVHKFSFAFLPYPYFGLIRF